MSNLPYKIVAVFSLIVIFIFGAALSSGVEVMKEQAERRGQFKLMLEIPPEALTQINARQI